MPGPISHVGAQILCPHGAPANAPTSFPRVLVSGAPVTTLSDIHLVTGCPFTLPGPKPSPCVTAQFLVGSVRVLAGGRPLVLQASTAICQSPEQAPQGPPTILTTQPRVIAT